MPMLLLMRVRRIDVVMKVLEVDVALEARG